MKRSIVVSVLLLCVAFTASQAEAGGILEFLFGSRPKMVQWFSPAADGDLHARNPFDLAEETFDLNGDGCRVVLDSGIPVERGLVLVGTVCPKTGPNPVGRWTARVDGSEEMLEVVEGPKPSDDQEQWLNYMVSRARYMRGSGARFRGFRTKTAPFYFAVDAGLLMMGAHSVEVFLWTGKREGAGVVLPFRVVRPVDEDTGQQVASEYEAPPQQAYAMPSTPAAGWPTILTQQPAPQYQPQPAWPTTPAPTQYGGGHQSPQQWGCWSEVVRIAQYAGYRQVFDRPTGPVYFQGDSASRAGTQPFVFFVVRAGRIDRVRDFCLIVNGQEWRGQNDGDGVVCVNDFEAGYKVAPVVDGRRLREMVVKPGQGIWYPVVVN